jgi:hypothetical protein
MRNSLLVFSALCCAAVAIGAGIDQPKDQKSPHKQPEQKQAEPKLAEPVQPESKPIPAAKPEDVNSLDAIIKAFYDATAGPAGKARDWDRLRSLFVNEARMIPVRHGVHGQGGNELLTMPVDGYIELNKNYFEKGGFFEKEVARRAEQFGNIAQVWSTYESRRGKDDPQPYVRGVYSIQLAFDGTRWWMVNVMWDTEQENAKLPEKYLKSPAPE